MRRPEAGRMAWQRTEMIVSYRDLDRLMRSGSPTEPRRISIPRDKFRLLLAAAVGGKSLFDEQFYVEFYPDIAAAVRSKRLKSGLDHYLDNGYFENRLPRKILVDESYYLQQNSDVADAIKKGKLKTAQDHFERVGFTEGRLPYKGFSLF
jgi:hypothetical protein